MMTYHAKDIKTGEWVEGWYTMYPAHGRGLVPCIVLSYNADSGDFVYIEIDPDTLGLNTGIIDREHSDIFEKDCLGRLVEDDNGKELVEVIGRVAYVADEGHFALVDNSDECVDWIYGETVEGRWWKQLLNLGPLCDLPERFKKAFDTVVTGKKGDNYAER